MLARLNQAGLKKWGEWWGPVSGVGSPGLGNLGLQWGGVGG